MKLRTWCIRIGQILTKTVLVFTGFLVSLMLFNPATIKAETGRGGITIRQQNVPLEKVFQSIEKQSGYRFFYNETLLQGAGKVTLNLQNASLQEALDACFHNQPLSYAIVDKTIIIKRKKEQLLIAPNTAAVSLSKPSKIIAVRGKVTSNNIPVAGASVMIKGTDNGASTDKDGIFTLSEVEDNATLVVSSVSHAVREIRINGQTFIAIDLAKQSDDLDEAVVVAYNTTTVKKNVGAITVVKGDQVRDLPFLSVDKALQGQVPGLLVTSGTGQPGGGLSNFVLRGIATGDDGTLGSTVRNPLIVIDGVPVTQQAPIPLTQSFGAPAFNPMAQFNTADIESITVLKDAAATALYGSKAGNGVILITTKKGKAGKTVFSFRHQADIAKRLKGKVELLNHDEYMELLYETYKNTPRTPSPWTDDLILQDLKSKFPAREDGSFYPLTNWENELYADHATTVSNDLTMSGGNERSNFYLNFEYTRQNGIFKKTGYDRKSVRFNFENRPTDWFKVGLNTTLSYNVQDFSALYGDPVGSATSNSALNPVRLEDGNYFLNFTNPTVGPNNVAAAEYNKNRNTSFRGFSKLYGEITFLKNFKFSSNLGVDFNLVEVKEKFDPRLFDAYTYSVGSGRITESDTRSANLITTNMLQFDKQVAKDHVINILAGQEAQVLNDKFQLANATNLRAPNYDQISSPGTSKTVEGNAAKQTLLSFFGQANYGFKNKYFLSGSIRTDGSSKFGDRERFGTFWSTGLGWVVTGENFMKGINWINYLKVRGSLGAAGNASAVNARTRYDELYATVFLNGLAPTPTTTPGNPDIKWEQTFTYDAGLEARFWNERLAITADVYKRKTSDVIYTTILPRVTGYTSVYDNIGNIENKGIELSVSLDVIRTRNLRWNFNANWSTNKNILVKANVPLASITGGILGNEEGRNFNSFYLVRWSGVNPDNGTSQWLDSTGTISSIFPSAQANRQFVGKPQPDGFGAVTNTFSFKNIELSALFYYQYGFQVFDASSLINDGGSPYSNQAKGALDRWRKPGDIAANPKRILNNPDGYRFSTRTLFDGDFIRLQNVTVSYNVPKNISDRLRLSMLKIYAQAYNLKLWTSFPGVDQGNANVQGSASTSIYPNARSFSIGVNLKF